MKINHANHELYYQQKILSSIIDELGTSIYKKRSSWRNVVPKFFTVDHTVIRNLFLRWTRQIYCGTKWSRFNGCSRMTPVPMNENTDVLDSRFTDHQIDHITRITRDILLLCLHNLLFSWKTQQGWKVRSILKDQSQYVTLSMCMLITGSKILTLFTLSSRRSKFYREESAGIYFADDFSGNSRDYLAITC